MHRTPPPPGLAAVLATMLLLCSAIPARGQTPATATASGDTVEERFPAPPGCRRVTVATGSFGEYLRRSPLKPAGSLVHDHTGRVVQWGAELGAVVDLDLIRSKGFSDLQQCADLAIRLWAEFRRSTGSAGDLAFTLQNGQRIGWRDWRSGTRYSVVGNRHVARAVGKQDGGDESFRRYLAYVMTWLGSAGLKAYLPAVARDAATVGDLFVQNHTGAIGHASVFFDRCDRGAERLFLVVESYMPAQEGHLILPAPGEGDGAWFTLVGLQRHLATFGEGVFRRFR